MPELMPAYTSYIESIVPWLEINARRIFGARGIVLPSRSSTNGFNNAFAPRFAGAYWVGSSGWLFGPLVGRCEEFSVTPAV